MTFESFFVSSRINGSAGCVDIYFTFANQSARELTRQWRKLFQLEGNSDQMFDEVSFHLPIGTRRRGCSFPIQIKSAELILLKLAESSIHRNIWRSKRTNPDHRSILIDWSNFSHSPMMSQVFLRYYQWSMRKNWNDMSQLMRNMTSLEKKDDPWSKSFAFIDKPCFFLSSDNPERQNESSTLSYLFSLLFLLFHKTLTRMIVCSHRSAFFARYLQWIERLLSLSFSSRTSLLISLFNGFIK